MNSSYYNLQLKSIIKKLLIDRMTTNKEPKKWKMAIIIWIAIVPLIFTIMPFFKPRLIALGLNAILSELLLTTILVLLMVYIAQPLLMKLFKNWLGK